MSTQSIACVLVFATALAKVCAVFSKYWEFSGTSAPCNSRGFWVKFGISAEQQGRDVGISNAPDNGIDGAAELPGWIRPLLKPQLNLEGKKSCSTKELPPILYFGYR
jgi:hypothetical protein